MRKEVTIAIFLGLGIGLLSVFGILTARSALTRYEQEKQTDRGVAGAISPAPSVSDTTSSPPATLTVTEPVDGSVTSENRVSIAGKAPFAEAIIVTSEINQFIIETNTDGKFQQDIELVNGENEIRLAAFFPSGERQDERITIVYTTAEF